VSSIDQSDDKEWIIKTEKVEHDLVKSMFDKISISPTGISEKFSEEIVKNFQVINDPNGKPWKVILPTNLEKFADNWIMLTAVAAIAVLDATIFPGPELEEITYPKEAAQYFHGISSALKGTFQGGTKYMPCSGSFQQGYRWALSHNDFITKNPRFFRTQWKHPRDLRIGKTVWEFSKNDDLKRWLNLITRACKKIHLLEPEKFAISYNRMKETLFKTTFSFEKGGVFDETERKSMIDSISQELDAYNEWVKSYSNLTIDMIVNFDNDLKKFKQLFEYNQHIGIVATQRAQILYSSSMKKKTAKGAWTLDERRSLLNPVEWILSTNRTGLKFGSTKISIIIPKGLNWEDPEVALDGLNSIKDRPELDDISKDWIDNTTKFLLTLKG